jgi:hypothetical protein
MEERLQQLKQRETEVWKRFEDPEITDDEKDMLEREIDRIHNEVMEIKRKIMGYTVKYGYN